MASTTATKERPVIFSGPMVRAILEGRKSQTRRVVKVPGVGTNGFGPIRETVPSLLANRGDLWDVRYDGDNPRAIPCPYGCPGDRLWVRETWGKPWHHAQPDHFYRASHESVGNNPDFDGWISSIHMPRTASRITLEITGVRVERLGDISEKDAWDEGFDNPRGVNRDYPDRARYWFKTTWDKLNAKRGFPFDSSPWVWVLEFRRIKTEGRPNDRDHRS